MSKLRKYTGKVSRWSVYLFLAVGSHSIIAGWVQAQPVSFVTARRFSAGSDPVSVDVGDFNADGNRDLAVANSGSNDVSVLLGAGDGTFAAPVHFPISGSPNSVLVNYFNGDSIQDLAVESSDSSGATSVSILLGNGDGTFRSPMSFLAGGAGLPLTSGDFNNDGFQDVVVGSVSPFTMGVVLLGNGDGTLRRPLNAAIGGSSLVSGYFNNDGILDLVDVASIFNRIRVHVGNGDGTFRAPIFSPVVRGPRTLELGYFNNDAIADLVVSDVDSGDVTVVLGNGDGTFQPGGFSGLILPGPFAVDDFDGDTFVDVAHGSFGGVGVALGRGDGSFRPPSISTAPSGSSFVVGEFNNDGRKDLVTITGNGVAILLGWGNGTFRGVLSYNLDTGLRPLSTFLTPTLARADFNGDGVQDLAVAIPGIFGKISVLLANGDGSFRFAFEFEAGEAADLGVGEFNGDGIQDLVAPGLIFLGNGNGSFQPALRILGVDSTASIIVGFVNGDGFPDVVAASRFVSTISVLLGNGDGTFAAPLSFDSGIPVRFPDKTSLAQADVDRDGRLDLLAANPSSGSISVLAGNGDGTFRAPLLAVTGGDAVSITVADFNGDQIADVAVGTASFGTILLLGHPDGGFQTPRSIREIRGEVVIGGDFNSDGIPDLAVTSPFLPILSVLQGNGDGTFQPAVDVETTNGSSLVVGNFTGDARLDLAVVGNLDAFSFRINTLSVVVNNTIDPRLTIESPELTVTGDELSTLSDTRRGFDKDKPRRPVTVRGLR